MWGLCSCAGPGFVPSVLSMNTRSIYATLLCCLFVQSTSALELRFSQGGVEVDAGSIGKLNLDYPVLLDGAQQQVHKIIEKTVAEKSATLRYEGGGQVGLSLANDGQVVATFATMPGDVKSVELAMQIPIGFNQGGKSKIGDTGAAFPVQKPARPHLFQGNATVSQITNYEGKTLEWTVPACPWRKTEANSPCGCGSHSYADSRPDTSVKSSFGTTPQRPRWKKALPTGSTSTQRASFFCM